MKIHVVLLVFTFSGSCTLEKTEEAGLIHHLKKRQTAEELGPVPYISREQYAPLPLQHNQDADSSSSSGNAVSSSSSSDSAVSSSGGSGGSDNQNSGNSVDHGYRQRLEDWVSSSNQGNNPASSSSQAQDPNPQPHHQHNDNAPDRSSSSSSQPSSSSSSQPSSSSSSGGVGGDRPYYQYQPPISSGHRQSSSSHSSYSSHSSSSSSSSPHAQFHLGSGNPLDNSQNEIPTQSHVAGVTRYTFRQPVDSAGSRRQSSSRVYSYPFSGGRNVGRSHVAILGSQVSNGGGGGGGGAGGGGGGGGQGQGGVPGVGGSSGGGNQASLIGDEEPVVQVFPSERPVVNPQASQQQLLRQREMERQRRLQLRRQQQQQSAAGNAQRRPSSGGQLQRPIYTGSQSQGGVYGQSNYYRGQPQQGNRQVYGGFQPVYGNSQGQPVYGSGVYGGQQPYYGGSYGGYGGFEQNGYYDNECPNTGIRIQINGIPCEQAVDHYGSYLCYRHEYTSRECCIKCRGLKNSARVGCEYGDHSGRCQQLQSYDCYDLRNRQSCCQSCERMRIAGARSGCEYGDMTPNCEQVRQNPGLCYIPENRYLCCQTCNTIRVTDDPECPWGDQNADLCQPFDRSGNIRINCYAPPIQRICCQACKRLEEWIPMNRPGCEYGDRPVTFNTGVHRNLNCTSFMRYYGYEQCSLNQAVATNCCYTCHRYNQG